MKKGIIISGNLAQDHEFIYPYYRLLEEEYEIDVCLLEGVPVKGILGTALPPNKQQKIKTIEDIYVKDYKVLVLPGGVKAMEKVRQEKKIISSKGASICELVMDPNEEQIPKAINKRNPDGKMVPTKFEDMYPFLSKQELNSNNYER